MKQTDWKNWIILPLLLTSCGGNEQKENNMSVPVRVEVLEVSPTAIVHTGHFTGTIEEKNGTALSFATAGTVRTMDVRLGAIRNKKTRIPPVHRPVTKNCGLQTTERRASKDSRP